MSKRSVKVSATVHAAITDGLAELSALRDELQDILDNVPDNLRHSPANEAREEAVNALSNFCDESSQDDLPEEVGMSAITYYEDRRRNLSRAARRDNAVAAMSAALEFLRDLVERDATSDEVSQIADDLENWISEAEDVVFPGMFG